LTLLHPSRIYQQTLSLTAAARLPQLIPGNRHHFAYIIALFIAAGLAWVFARTAAGFRIRSVGASPTAARIAGKIDVERTSTLVFLFSGALAGIAGGVEVGGVTFALYENLSPGYGYTAIAVALIAGLNPLGVVASGIFFGFLETGAIALQREFAVPSSIASIVEAALILAALTVAVVRGKGILAKAGAT
jgi:simple sugar transport system permease protein